MPAKPAPPNVKDSIPEEPERRVTIIAAGTATMDISSEVEGDVTAKSMILNGKI